MGSHCALVSVATGDVLVNTGWTRQGVSKVIRRAAITAVVRPPSGQTALTLQAS